MDWVFVLVTERMYIRWDAKVLGGLYPLSLIGIILFWLEQKVSNSY